MAKGKGKGKGKAARGPTVTLKAAVKAVRVTPDRTRRLVLSNMRLTHFPRCLLQLTDLDELDLSRNLIRSLPDDLGHLVGLSRLDLHSNQLETLPESIGGLAALTHLDLSNNRLSSAGLPPALGSLGRLTSLNLGLNRLDALPDTVEALTGLRELGLFDNLFTELPRCVTALLGGLDKLNTARNPLSDRGGDGGRETGSEPVVEVEVEEEVYLVSASRLCEGCLERCKEREIGGQTRGEGGRGFGENPKGAFSGLRTPNSVALLRQDVWRRQ